MTPEKRRQLWTDRCEARRERRRRRLWRQAWGTSHYQQCAPRCTLAQAVRSAVVLASGNERCCRQGACGARNAGVTPPLPASFPTCYRTHWRLAFPAPIRPLPPWRRFVGTFMCVVALGLTSALYRKRLYFIMTEALVVSLFPLSLVVLPLVAPRWHLRHRHWMLTLLHT